MKNRNASSIMYTCALPRTSDPGSRSTPAPWLLFPRDVLRHKSVETFIENECDALLPRIKYVPLLCSSCCTLTGQIKSMQSIEDLKSADFQCSRIKLYA
eukprot:1136791-Pelagomonas_calceolata.AAC.3